MAKPKKELNFRVRHLNLTDDGNTSIVLAVTKAANDDYIAYTYAVQKTPNTAVLLYRWNVGTQSDHDTALKVASEELADRWRYLITLTLGERNESI